MRSVQLGCVEHEGDQGRGSHITYHIYARDKKGQVKQLDQGQDQTNAKNFRLGFTPYALRKRVGALAQRIRSVDARRLLCPCITDHAPLLEPAEKILILCPCTN